MICALGLLFFSVSGVWMYLELYRSRASYGRKQVFWATKAGAGAVMRSLHRWITLPFGFFGLLLSLTGASLDVYFAYYHQVPLPPPRKMGGLPQGPRPTGPPGPPPDGQVWHGLSLSLHKLNFLGPVAHPLGVLVGVALFVLAVSGAWMYASLYLQRRKAGRPEFLW
jgi:PepSY-associated TM region